MVSLQFVLCATKILGNSESFQMYFYAIIYLSLVSFYKYIFPRKAFDNDYICLIILVYLYVSHGPHNIQPCAYLPI